MRIYLGGYLDFYNPQSGSWLNIELDKPTPLKDLILSLNFPAGDIRLVVVNGQLEDLDEVTVSEQDEVKLYSAVGGG